MFSPRYLAALALLAFAAAKPATDYPFPEIVPVTSITADDFDDTPWFNFPLFGNLFAPLWKLLPTFSDIGPKIISDDKNFEVIVNVKDYKKEDLKVKVKGCFIFVQGTHEAKHDDHDLFASQFFHTYSLPANCSNADVKAELYTDDFLVINAPLDGTKDKENVDRDVTIVETGKPYKTEDKKPEKENDDKPAVPEEVADKKEPTTPAVEREEITEKDNVIPHGNEVENL